MSIQLRNTLSGKYEVLTPKNGPLKLYVCGPSLINYIHLGNLRTFLIFDMASRFLRSQGYQVNYVQNITDVNEDIIQATTRSKTSIAEFTKDFEVDFFKHIKDFELTSVTKYLKVTEFTQEIVENIRKLSSKGFVYSTSQGVFFNTRRIPGYLEMALKNRESLRSQSLEEVLKGDQKDFPLWFEDQNSELSLSTELGIGRPGWHIQDATLISQLFGDNYDMHGGSKDLIYPHHQAIISIMRALHGQEQPLRYLLNTGYLTLNREKMAKSSGKVVFVKKVSGKVSPQIIRLFLLSEHYQNDLEYSESELQKAATRYQDLETKFRRLRQKGRIQPVKMARATFNQALADNLDSPRALSVLFSTINKADSGDYNGTETKKFVRYANSIFRILKDEN